jgi:hypothetical protein
MTPYQQRFVITTIYTGKLDKEYATWQMNKWAKEVPELLHLKEFVKAELELRRLAKG